MSMAMPILVNIISTLIFIVVVTVLVVLTVVVIVVVPSLQCRRAWHGSAKPAE